MIGNLRISSISDVVTNSSTEVFLIPYYEKLDDLLGTLFDNDWVYVLTTEEKVKECFFEQARKGYLEAMNKLFDEEHQDRLCDDATFEDCQEEGLSDDEIWVQYRDIYMNLCGCIYSYIPYERDKEDELVLAILEGLDENCHHELNHQEMFTAHYERS